MSKRAIEHAHARLARAYIVLEEARKRGEYLGWTARAGRAHDAAQAEVLRALLAYALTWIRYALETLLALALTPLFWILWKYRLYLEWREWRRTVRAMSQAFELEVHTLQGKARNNGKR